MQRPILLIDGLNIFVRHYLSNPALSNDGSPMGGVVGVLSTISQLTRELKPESIFIIWESGGSAKRRNIFPDYKANRKPKKLNRFYDDMNDGIENEAQQKLIVVELLKTIPVCQIYVENCEADDVIGYLCRNNFFNQKKIVVSSDKDYYQLLDSQTWIYSPARKTYIFESNVMEEFNISAKNFCVAKAFCGDTSDNIPGVPRVGFKTLAKKFPVLGSCEEISINDVLLLNDQAMQDRKKSKQKFYQNINESIDVVKRNWKLMYLDSAMLDPQQVIRINKFVINHNPKKNKFQFYKVRRKYGLESAINADLFLSSFSYFPEVI